MAREFMDTETGELIEVASFRTQAQQDAFQDKKKRDAVTNKAKSPFVFSEMETLQGVLSTLSNKELGYFLLMQTYVDYKNMLKVNADARNPMKSKDIAEVLSITTQTVNILLKKLEKKELISRNKIEVSGKQHKAVFINDAYCFRKGIGAEFSNKKTDRAVKVFINSLQDAYNEGLQPAEIGFIYKTIQFIHYDSNLLVTNPTEKELRELNTLSLEALAKIMKLSVTETSRRLTSIQWNNMYVFGRIRVGRKLRIKANPYLLYRKAGEFDGALGAEFIVNG